MTSRFVSGGTISGDSGSTGGNDGAEGVDAGDSSRMTTTTTSVEWEAVQRDLEEERRRRADARKLAVEGGMGGERSLYEVLQANKAAKQAAFEEQNRIRNQFRALDDDEIDFLHGVSDGRRAEEERVRRETEEGLVGFRIAQRAVGGTGDAADAESLDGGAEEWTAASGRKRKREREKVKVKAGLKGVRRRTSTAEEEGKDGEKGADEKAKVSSSGNDGAEPLPTESTTAKFGSVTGKVVSAVALAQTTNATTANPKPKPALGLVDYGSDEDSEG